MTPGQIVLLVAVVLALGFGTWRMRTDGRFGTSRASGPTRGPADPVPASTPDASGQPLLPSESAALDFEDEHSSRTGATAGPSNGPAPDSTVADTPFADELGERATLLQFSSAFCAPCRVTRRTLAEVAQVVPGVRHVEVDAEEHLDLVRRVGVLRTPTTLVLDADGFEVSRAAGAPRKEQVLAALAAALD